MDTRKTEQAQQAQHTHDDDRSQEERASSAADDTARGDTDSDAEPARKKRSVKAKSEGRPNNVRKLRMEQMMSKAELARRASLSTLTIDRVEKGMPCRMDTKRKILEALGLTPSDRVAVFGEDD